MFEESIGGGISFEMEVIFLICDVKNIIFGIVTFFINKHRNLCLKEICLFSMSTYNFFMLLLFSLLRGFLFNSKSRVECTAL